MGKTATIYASYGVLGHENEVVWGITPADGTPAFDEVTVELPDGYAFEESVYGEQLVVAEDGTTERLVKVMATATRSVIDPFLYFPTGDSWRKVPLTVIDANGD